MLVEVGDIEYFILCYVDRVLEKRIMLNDKKIRRLFELISFFKFVFFELDIIEFIKY